MITNANLTGPVTSTGNVTAIANGAITNSMLANAAVATLSGTNTGDQTITLTGGVTGSGTGSFAATVVTNANLTGPVTSTGNATAIAAGVVTKAMLVASSFGQFYQSGAQPGAIEAKQAFTFTSQAGPASGISKLDGQTTNLSVAVGSIFILEKIGTYDVEFRAVIEEDGGIQLAVGETKDTLIELAYTIGGRTVGATQIGARNFITTTTENSCMCVIASPGNAVALQSASAGTTNTAMTTVIIDQIR